MIITIIWTIVILVLLAALGAQYEIYKKDEIRSQRRAQMREATWEEIERINYLS